MRVGSIAGTDCVGTRGGSGTLQTPDVEVIVFNLVKNHIILMLCSKQERKVTHEKLKDQRIQNWQ